MKKGIIAIGLLAIFVFALTPAGVNAWTITKELQDEVAEKEKALAANPSDPYAHFDLAITYSYSNKVQEGWDELKKVNDLDDNFAPAALAKYQALVHKNPNDWKLRFRLVFALYFDEKKQEAINQLYYIAGMEPKDDPKRIWAYGYMGLIYGEMDKVDEAIAYVKKGLAIDNNAAALHLLLASGYYKKGDSWGAFWEGVESLRLKSLGY
jgi:tetratricopeptide (TPR) repeat protein